MTIEEALAASGLAGSTDASYSPLPSPEATETLGRALAESLDADVVCYWDGDDLALAHVVARELGARLVQGLDAQGVAELEGEVNAGDRVVVVASLLRNKHHLLAVRAVVAARGGEVVGVTVCQGSTAVRDGAGDLPVRALVEA